MHEAGSIERPKHTDMEEEVEKGGELENQCSRWWAAAKIFETKPLKIG